MELKEHVKRQLSFLESSAAAFDAGKRQEAVRIATAIRVLVHETKASRSLLGQLAIRDSLKLVSTVELLRGNIVVFEGAVATHMFSNAPARFLPKLGMGSTRHLMHVQAWWEQPVWIAGERRASRRDVVLGAANKDGGAHVDTHNVPEAFATLQKGAWATGPIVEGVPGPATPIIDHHLAMLRQFAYELLNSEELLALVR